MKAIAVAAIAASLLAFPNVEKGKPFASPAP